MPLAAWVHDLSPIAFELGPFPIRWYGLSYALGFVVAWALVRQLGKRGLILIPAERAGDFIVSVAFGAIIGGRVGYVLFYRPSLLVDFSADFPWWGLLRINEGGMASHGGMVGLIVASYLFVRALRRAEREADAPTRIGPDDTAISALPRSRACLHVLDVAAFVSPFGLLFGRLANFVNGELLGRVVAMPGERAPWWAVKYPHEVLTDQDVPRTPEQWRALWDVVRPYVRDPDTLGRAQHAAEMGDSALAVRLAAPAYERVLVAIQAGNAELAAQLAPLLSARHPSQLYQAAAEGLVLGAVLWWIWRKPRRPGVVGSWFLITYGVLRMATEIWRLPDAHLEVQRVLGLSRGQWLSAAMVVAGVVILLVLGRRGGPRLGGWLTRARA